MSSTTYPPSSILHRPSSVKAVIFDFDGVILESANIKTEACLELFADYPQHQDAILQYHLDNMGISRYVKFEWIYRELLQAPYTAADRDRLGQAFSDLVLQKILACPFVPGALEALQTLHGRYPLFVASGTPQEELDLITAQRDVAQYFTEIWGTPRRKPEIITDILTRYRLEPEQVLMVGDGVSDYEAAVATNIQFLARITPELADKWAEVGATAVPDLTGWTIDN
jgi:HAD superfamily hydrolase (TIGR01549 family)